MERRPALAIAKGDEVRLGIEHLAQRRRVVRVRRQMDRMIRRHRAGCRDPDASADRLLEDPGESLVTAVARNCRQALSIGTHGVRLRAGREQNLDGLDVTLPYRKAERLAVARQLRIALEQAAQGRGIARAGGANRVPHVATAARPGAIRPLQSKLLGLDQVDGATRGAGTSLELRDERGPTGKSMLTRERVLHVAQARVDGRLRMRARQACPRLLIARAQRLEPALRFLLEILEGRGRTDLRSWKPSFR